MDHVIDRRRLLRISYLLLVVVVLFCLYALFSPKPISFLRPLTVANIPVATQTKIVEVKPGDVTVLARRPVDVQVTVADKKPDRVLFHFTTKDQSFVNEQLEMTPSAEREGEYLLLFAGENGEGIGQQIRYYVTAGDARSDTYTIDVETAPTAEIDRIEYRYPDYMELEPRSQFIGAVDAWEGTEVELTARIGNKIPVKSATLQFVDRQQQNGAVEEIPLKVIDNNRIAGKWTLTFREDGTYAREYRIVCTSKEGLKDPSPPTYPITIRPDEAPEVALLDPTGDLEKPANAVIPLLFKARDPDFKLHSVTLRAEKDGQELQSYLIFDADQKGEKKAIADRYRWELKPLGLQPGDVVSFFLEARDNKEPFGNRRTTQPLKLTIIAPAEQEQVEEQLQQEEQKQEPQLQEEQRQAAEENGEEGSGESSSEQTGEEEGADSEEEQTGEQTQEKEGEQGGEQEKPSEGNNEENEGDKGDDGASKTPGEKSETSEAGNQKSDMPTEGEENASGEPQEPLKNDGTDDAEVLEKIVKDQQENPEPAATPPPDEQTEGQKSKSEEQAGGGEGEPDQTPGSGTGEQQADDGMQDDMPPKPGDGQGTPNDQQPDNQNKPDSEGDSPSEGKQENTTEEGPAEKRPGDPDTKGTGTPDENPDPNAPRASDPNNLKREEGTKPSTVPSEKPKPQDDLPKENTSEKPKQQPKGGEGSGKSPDPTAPNQPEGADEPKPGENDPNQRSKQPQGGEEGASQQASDGAEGETGTGDSKPSDKPGSTSENQEGKPGGKPGQQSDNGEQSAEGDSQQGGKTPSDQEGSGAASQNQPAEGEASKSQGSGTSSQSGATDADGPPGAPQGGSKPGLNNRGKGEAAPVQTTPEKQNLENAKQAADLVLKRLEKQLERGEVNDELLKELGWTEDEMKAFTERMRRQLTTDSSELAAEERVKQHQFEEMLKNMNFDPEQESATRKTTKPGRSTRSISGGQRTLPLEYRDAFEEFTRKLNRRK
jgi:hypothetical protein